MITIHPMTAHGSVREFVGTPWMTFGDYQQNYRQLHARILESRQFDLPVVNSEYGYFLRDANGDGLVDKHNSFDVNAIRHASWDIVMGGGYLVTGFGTTYFGGNRDPGPFDIEADKNDVWEGQIQHIGKLFTTLEWWKLAPADDRITCSVARSDDRTRRVNRNGRTVSVAAPPKKVYWLLADAGRTYVAYVRGVEAELTIAVDPGTYSVRQYNPRTGDLTLRETRNAVNSIPYQPPDGQDWVLLLTKP
jgi:hypothetical protein